MGNYEKARGAAPWIMLNDCSQQIINCFTWSVELLWTDSQRINYHVVLSVCSGNPISVQLVQPHENRRPIFQSVRHLERPGLYSYLLVFDISDSHIHILVFDATSGHFQQYLVRLTWSLVAVTGGLDLSDISNETSGWFQLCFLTKCLVFSAMSDISDVTLGHF